MTTTQPAAPPEDAAPIEESAGRIRLTAAGLQIIDQMCSARADILQEQLAEWSPEQHADLLAMLQQLADNSLDAPSHTLAR